jgi:DNA-binding transcriptional MerR regulator/rhodanese-related sulfurtransferase
MHAQAENTPVFSRGSAACMLGVSVQTLRSSEAEGLILPEKSTRGRRRYSRADVERLECVRHAITEQKIGIAGAAALLLAALLVFLPNRKEALLAETADPAYQQSHTVKLMTPDELAFRILDNDPGLVIVDVRGAKEFQKMTLPGAVNIPVHSLFGKEWSSLLGVRHRQRVFIDNDGTMARNAGLLAARLGYTNVSMLEGGLNALRSTILDFRAPAEPPPRALEATYRFRARASVMLPKMIEEGKNKQSMPETKTKKIAGGC